MTADRDALAELIGKSLAEGSEDAAYMNSSAGLEAVSIDGWFNLYTAADAIIAAGWTSPRDHRMEKILDAMGATEADGVSADSAVAAIANLMAGEPQEPSAPPTFRFVERHPEYEAWDWMGEPVHGRMINVVKSDGPCATCGVRPSSYLNSGGDLFVTENGEVARGSIICDRCGAVTEIDAVDG